MALGIIAEALARIEYKLDLIIEKLMMGTRTITPMHFIGHSCPVCGKRVDYQIDVSKNVVIRHCGCSTGKLPMTIPLTPVNPNGEIDGNTINNRSNREAEDESSPWNRNRR